MKQYLKAYAVMLALTISGLFLFGMVVGVIGQIISVSLSGVDPSQMLRGTGFIVISNIAFAVSGFFSFRFSVRKFFWEVNN
jgi:hypothetical protein